MVNLHGDAKVENTLEYDFEALFICMAVVME